MISEDKYSDVCSSAVVWEGYHKNRYRPLTTKLSQHLEGVYGKYLVSLQTNRAAPRRSVVAQQDVNFEVDK